MYFECETYCGPASTGLNLWPYIQLGPRDGCESVDQTAGVTGKGGSWQKKPPDAGFTVWGRFPESAGKPRSCPEHVLLGFSLEMDLNFGLFAPWPAFVW